MPRTPVKAVIFAALLACAAAAPALAGGPVNATQAREDHANHDRWARSDKKPADDKKSKDDSDDADDQDGGSKKDMVPPHHQGELNGKLHLGEW